MVTFEDKLKMLKQIKEDLFDATQAALREQSKHIEEVKGDWDHEFEQNLIHSGMNSMQLTVLLALDAQIIAIEQKIEEAQEDAHQVLWRKGATHEEDEKLVDEV